MTEPIEVHVDIDGSTVHAGTARFASATRGGRQPSSFEYRASYLTHPRAYALDPGLPLATGVQFRSHGLFGSFGDSAPDRWGKRLIERAQSERRFLSDADYLLAVDDGLRHGSIRFRDSRGWLATGGTVPRLVDLPELADRARTVDVDPKASVKLLLDVGSATLGGARPKATVSDGRHLWLAKFARVRDIDEWNVIGLEKTALDLAALCGIDVPARRLVGNTLLVKRFDREQAQRIGYLSAMSVLEHGDGETGDYLDLAMAIEEISAAPDADLRELWLRAAFSVAIHNTDDHLQNHGFVRARQGWRLSPVFDVNPNPVLGEARATTIAAADGPEREVAALETHAPEFRMSTAEARAALRRIHDVLADWRSVAASNGVAASDISVIEPAFTQGRTLTEAR